MKWKTFEVVKFQIRNDPSPTSTCFATNANWQEIKCRKSSSKVKEGVCQTLCVGLKTMPFLSLRLCFFTLNIVSKDFQRRMIYSMNVCTNRFPFTLLIRKGEAELGTLADLLNFVLADR